MRAFRTSNIKFGTKIALGFAAILILSGVSIALANFGLQRVALSAASFQEIVTQSDATRDIDRELVAFRLLVKYFAVTGDDPDREAAVHGEAALDAAVDRAIKLMDPSNKPAFERLQGSYVEFRKLFAQIVSLKTTNTQIGIDELRLINTALRGQIDGLLSATDNGDSIELNTQIKEYAVDAAAAAAAINNYVSRADEAIAAGASAKLLTLRKKFERLKTEDETVKRSIADINRQILKYNASFEKYAANSSQIDELIGQANKTADIIVDNAASIKAAVADNQRRIAFEAKSTVASTTEWVTMTGLGGLLAGMLLALVLGRGISRPMVGMCKAMRELAGGNMDVVLPGLGRRDEIGEMASAVEEFKVRAVDKARREAQERQILDQSAAAKRRDELGRFASQFESAVGSIVTTVATSASQLEASAGLLTYNADVTLDLSSKASGASEEASGDVQSVASATEQLSASITEIGRQVQESSRIATAAVEQADLTNERIAKLSDAAHRIGDVVKLISDIASRTNLLALNATIEAARAGDTGRGFAVVASEVKSLATQTAKATDEIASHVSSMQAATLESVRAIKEIGDTIGEISQIASTISTSVEQQGGATREIAESIQRVALRTHDVASNIVEVNRSTEQTGSASEEVLKSAKTLTIESERLRIQLDDLMTGIRAA